MKSEIFDSGRVPLEKTESVGENIEEIKAENRELKERVKFLEDTAWVDSLTGLSNRRYFDQKLDELLSEVRGETKKHNRVNDTPRVSEVALILVDLDNFKQANDTHGHHMGDSVLRRVGQLLQETFRETDIPARHGGDEFAVIFTNTTQEKAALIAEKFRVALENDEELTRLGITEPRITASIGVAYADSSTKEAGMLADADTLVKQADAAMYRAKSGGRNKVEMYTEL